MLNSQNFYPMEDGILFSMSVPRNMFIQNNNNNINIIDICGDSNRNIPPVLLSPILISNSQKAIQVDNFNNIDNISKIQDDERMFTLNNSKIISASEASEIGGDTKKLDDRSLNTEESGHNNYNMAQQNYQVWLSSF